QFPSLSSLVGICQELVDHIGERHCGAADLRLSACVKVILLLDPQPEGGFPLRVISHLSEVAERAANLFRPTPTGMGEEWEVRTRLLDFAGPSGLCRLLHRRHLGFGLAGGVTDTR